MNAARAPLPFSRRCEPMCGLEDGRRGKSATRDELNATERFTNGR